MTTAEIITIGTELLLGETVDTNTCFIARTLREEGVNLYRTQIIGDNAKRITALIRESLTRADIVITSGGLGPTVDDPTREAAALATDQILVFSPTLWETINYRITRNGRTPTENQKKQAYIPEFAIPIDNPVGTAPAFIVEQGKKSLICLPGVPKEMQQLLMSAVIPYLQTRFNLNEIILIRTLHVSGLGEGVIDQLIGDLENLSNPTVGLAAHSGVVSIRITGKGELVASVKKLIEEVEIDLRQRLGDAVFGCDDDTLERVTLERLMQKGWSISCVEYQTKDHLKTLLSQTSVSNFLGGTSLAQMEKSISSYLEIEMTNFGTEVGIGIACIREKDEMTGDVAIVTPFGKYEYSLRYGGPPDNFQFWITNMALDLLRRHIFRIEIPNN